MMHILATRAFKRSAKRLIIPHYRSSIVKSLATLPSDEQRDAGLEFTSVVSHPKEVEGPEGIPSRAQQLENLKQSRKTPYNVLIIGGGATGSGAALDAASRGLSVACIERGDFASETSSRSTKLIWAGIRYMATATVALLSTNFPFLHGMCLHHPLVTLSLDSFQSWHPLYSNFTIPSLAFPVHHPMS